MGRSFWETSSGVDAVSTEEELDVGCQCDCGNIFMSWRSTEDGKSAGNLLAPSRSRLSLSLNFCLKITVAMSIDIFDRARSMQYALQQNI